MKKTNNETLNQLTGTERIKVWGKQLFEKSNMLYILSLILVVAITLIVFRVILFIGWVPSGSMEPTIKINDVIIANRLVKEPKDGDILIFKMGRSYLIKRVYATEGEKINLTPDHKVSKDKNGNLTVPKNCYFMCGDNVNNSYDSRYWPDPFLKKKNIIAKYCFKIPLSKINHKKNYNINIEE